MGAAEQQGLSTCRSTFDDVPCTYPEGHGGYHVAYTAEGAPLAWLAGQRLKLRDGDQQLPTVNDRPDVQSQVIADIEERRQVGIQRYGTALQPFNGRNAVQDLYEELIDGAMYAKQWLIERGELLDRVAELEAEVERLRDAR